MQTIASARGVAAVLFAAATATALAADFHEGLAAHRRGDYEAALREWRPLAAQGDAESQYRLARMYSRGEGVRDDAEAARWYRRAADQGHPQAQNNLGVLYEEGRGVEQDFAAALGWYRKAAAQAVTAAQLNLARMYDLGRGLGQDAAEAAKWYLAAADQGQAKAQYRLGVMHELGTGVPTDSDKAAKWYLRAARQGHGPAQAALGSMYAEGRGVSRDPQKAARWLARASAQGIVASAMTRPGEAPDDEPEPLEDDAPADTTAAPAGVPEIPAGALPPDDVEVGTTASPAPPPPPTRDLAPAAPPPSDYPELRAVTHEAEQGDREACYRLARMYSSGEGAPQSMDAAARWYLAAAERGHDLAAYKLAFLYMGGRGLPRKDFVQAHRWFSVAAELGVGDAGAWRDKIAKKMTEQEIAESARLLGQRATEGGR